MTIPMRIPLALFNLHLYTHISKDEVVFEGGEKVNIKDLHY